MSGASGSFEESPAMQIRCPHCHHPIEVVDEKLLEELVCPSCGSNITLISRDTTVGHDESALPSTTRLEPRRLGHFELLEEVGLGGFGAVWKARDTVLDRVVALKIPRRSQLTSAEAEYFLRDARAAAQLRHPHIVSVHEVGRDGETYFIASDFVEGANLHEWMSARRLTVREVAELVAQIAEAVQHAHDRGVVHRDLKPGNILMDSAGRPHVTDFGLAKRETGEITMTVDGQILGTPAYMSPEQARGKAHEADAKSDVYSLGVILFELLTGELPFRGEKRMLIVQILNDDPPSPRKLNGRVPRDLETICLKCLEKEPKKRYATMADVAADLQRQMSGESIIARRTNAAVVVGRKLWRRQRPLVLVLAVLAFVFAVEGGKRYRERRKAQWQLGAFEIFAADGATRMTADLLDPVDSTAIQRVAVPSVAPIKRPSGDYRLRVVSSMLRDETYQMLVEREVTTKMLIPVEKPLWPPINFRGDGESVRVLVRAGRPTIVMWTRSGQVRAIDAETGRVVWDVEPWAGVFTLDEMTPTPGVQPLPDMNSDGSEDLLFVEPLGGSVPWAHPAWAVSGSDGQLLWKCATQKASVFGSPVVTDADGDGVLDVIALLVEQQADNPNRTLNAPTFAVVAFSGQDGSELWRYAFDPHKPRRTNQAILWPMSVWPSPAGAILTFGAGSHFFALSAHTGTLICPPFSVELRADAYLDHQMQTTVLPSGETVFSNAPLPPGRFVVSLAAAADFDGDEIPELLIAYSDGSVTAISLQRQTIVWNRDEIGASWKEQGPLPVVVDVDGDAALEIILPSRVGKLFVVDALSGADHWPTQQIHVGDSVYGLMAIASDDGGNRDLLVLSDERNGPLELVRIDGRNGKEIFRKELLQKGDFRFQGLAEVLGTGADNASKLFYWTGDDADVRPFEFSAGEFRAGVFSVDGRTWPVPYRFGRLHVVRTEDDESPIAIGEAEGTLTAARVEAGGMRWQRLGAWRPTADLDGDGCDDAIMVQQSLGIIRPSTPHLDYRTSDFEGNEVQIRAAAVSGKDGHLLWHDGPEADQLWSFPAPLGDLDGDKAADVLAIQCRALGSPVKIHAISGKSGAALWTLSPAKTGWSGRHYWSEPHLENKPIAVQSCPDVDGDGRPDVWMSFEMAALGDEKPKVYSFDEVERHWWLGMISGSTGHVLWHHETPGVGGADEWKPLHPMFSDLDGNGLCDHVYQVPDTKKGGCILRAVRGINGEELWNHHFETEYGFPNRAEVFESPWRTADLDGDGKSEVVVIDGSTVTALDGVSGRQLWVFEAPAGWDFHGRWNRWRLATLHRGERPVVCIDGRAGLIILDHAGHHRQLPGVGFTEIGDLDGDGDDELLRFEGEQAQALDGDGRKIWDADIPDYARYPDIVSRGPGEPVTVVIAARSKSAAENESNGLNGSNELLALDGATGSTLWTMPRGQLNRNIEVLRYSDPRKQPHYLEIIGEGFATVCH